MQLKKLLIGVAAFVLFATAAFVPALLSEGYGGDVEAEDEAEIVREMAAFDDNLADTLTVAIMNGSQSEEDIVKKAYAGFKKKYPNITLNIQKVQNYESQVKTDIASGSPYDVLWVSDQYVDTFADDYVKNLSPYISASGFDTSLYYESAMKLGQKNHDGDQYFLPRDYNKLVVYLNKKIFNDCGVELPTDNDWTWADFKRTCFELYENGCDWRVDGRAAVSMAFDWRILVAAFTKSYGGVIVNEDGTINIDEKCQAAIAEMKTLIDNDYASYRGGESTRQDFQGNKAAMHIQVRPYAASYYESLKNNLAVVAFPQIEGEGGSFCGAGTTGYSICRTTHNRILAWKFIEYIASEEGQEQISLSGAIVPSYKSIAENPSAKWRKAVNIPNVEAFIYDGTEDAIYDFYDMLPDVYYFNAYDGNIVEMLTTYFKGEKTLEVAVEKCRQEIKKFVAREGNLVPIKK